MKNGKLPLTISEAGVSTKNYKGTQTHNGKNRVFLPPHYPTTGFITYVLKEPLKSTVLRQRQLLLPVSGV